jgi:hypothetical protein
MKFLSVLLTLLALAAHAVALDREAFTFTNYQLNVRVEPEQQRLGVRGAITLRNDSAAPQKTAALQISSSLAWRAIKVDGKPVQYVTQPLHSDIDHTGALSEAVVTLPRSVPPKSTIELEIGYEGQIPQDATRLTQIGTPGETATHSDWDQISPAFTALRGIGYVAWYPIATEPAGLSDGPAVFDAVARWKSREAAGRMHFDVCQTGPADTMPLTAMNDRPRGVGSLSSLPGPNTSPDITRCAGYEFAPLGATTPILVIGNLTQSGKGALSIYHLSEHKPEAESWLKASELIAPFVSGWLGAARTQAQVVDLPDPQAAPFESGAMMLTPLKSANDIGTTAIVHLLAHASLDSPRPWIYEGVAHFIEAVYAESLSGRKQVLDVLSAHRADLVAGENTAAEKTQPASMRALGTTFDETLYRAKAPAVWWMLRDMLGDDALKKALAAYQPAEDKDAAYMQHLLEAQSKRDLGWFFDDWVYHDRGLPDFAVASVFVSRNDQGYLATVTVQNAGDAAAEVPVTLRFQGDATTKRVEIRAKSNAVVRMQVNGAPQQVVVNDGSVPESDVSNNTYEVR